MVTRLKTLGSLEVNHYNSNNESSGAPVSCHQSPKPASSTPSLHLFSSPKSPSAEEAYLCLPPTWHIRFAR